MLINQSWRAVLLCGLLTACTNAPRRPIESNAHEAVVALPSLVHDSASVQHLTGTMFVTDPVIGQPGAMVTNGGLLWVTDRSGNPAIHAVDLATGAVVSSQGRAGEGPGDFAGISNLSVRPGDTDGVWAFDTRLRRLTRIERSPSPTGPLLSQLPVDEQAIRWLWVGPSTMLSIGAHEADRYTIRDETGRALERQAAALLGSDSVPMRERESASTGVLVCANLRQQLTAVLYSDAGRIDLIDQHARFVDGMRTPFPVIDAFGRDTKGHWAAAPSRYHYRSCARSDRFLYALYSGRSARDYPEPAMFQAEYVHVFDWESRRVVAMLGLGRETTTIAVSGDSLLYGASDEGGGVWKYRLLGGSPAVAAVRPR